MSIKERIISILNEESVPGISVAILNDEVIESITLGLANNNTQQTMDPNHLFHACSISKIITALTTLILVEKGLLELDQDINDMLTTWTYKQNEFTSKKKVTLRSLLSHQSGFIDCEESFGTIELYGFPTMKNLLNGKTPYHKKQIEVKYEPFSQFVYSDIGYCIIEQLIEDVTRNSFKDIVKKELFLPLKLQNTIYNHQGQLNTNYMFANGHHLDNQLIEELVPIYPYLAAAGLISTPTDIAIILKEIMNLNNNKGILPISKKTITDFLTSQGDTSWAGLGIFLAKKEEHLQVHSLGWGEGFQSMLVAYPELNSGAVVMINQNPGIHQMKSLIGKTIKEIISYYDWPN